MSLYASPDSASQMQQTSFLDKQKTSSVFSKLKSMGSYLDLVIHSFHIHISHSNFGSSNNDSALKKVIKLLLSHLIKVTRV